MEIEVFGFDFFFCDNVGFAVYPKYAPALITPAPYLRAKGGIFLAIVTYI